MNKMREKGGEMTRLMVSLIASWLGAIIIVQTQGTPLFWVLVGGVGFLAVLRQTGAL